ncbi:hypothetical protein PHJA_002918200 [Phtheirospermum japonicum]|uniref:Uncharacterized protein n=1 Tax=Phtheirospermum japonicum TaxID=374723 RepID=A0A830DPX8_9LAMI|nr:hypothetical protein PHJA_002918200 [Phtheirospermum japonicum]
MANARLARFITEVAPPQFISVMRHRTSKMLDTIHEEERESGAKILAQSSHNASTKTNKNLLKEVQRSLSVFHD